MHRWGTAFLLVVLAFGSNWQTFADESLFGYSYGSDTLPDGQREWATWVTHRWDKGIGSYNATDLLIEFEYGVTDRLTVAAYLQGLRLKARDAFAPDRDGNDIYPREVDITKLAVYKGSLKYNFLSPYKHKLGLSFVWELFYTRWFPKVDGARTEQYSFEPKLILQKNFLDDTLVLIYNLALESEWRKFPEDNAFENEFSITNSTGVSWRFKPKWFVGFEARHHQDILNGEKNHSDVFVGPNLHVGTKGWYLTITYLRQIHGNPTWSGYDVDLSEFPNDGYHFEEDTKHEFRFKFGWNLG
jgi:hypothetical protein